MNVMKPGFLGNEYPVQSAWLAGICLGRSRFAIIVTILRLPNQNKLLYKWATKPCARIYLRYRPPSHVLAGLYGS